MIFKKDSLINILQGSFENLIERVDSAVKKQHLSLFDDALVVSTMAVFKDNAVVCSDKGDIIRVFYEDKNGEIIIVGEEKVDIPAYNSREDRKLTKEEATEVVDYILEGRVDEALGKLLDMVKTGSSVNCEADKSLVESIISSFSSEAPWRKIYTEQNLKIRKFLRGDLASLDEVKFSVKYKKLYDGTTEDSDLEQHANNIREDLKSLTVYGDKLISSVESALESVSDIVNSVKSPDDDAVISMFTSFSEDLINDLREKSYSISEASKNIQCVSCLAQLYDNAAVSMYDYDVAGKFVQRMAEKLQQS